MGNKSSNTATTDLMTDGLSGNQRETISTWYRRDIAVTDVYDLIETLGQGHMGEVYKVHRKRESRGLHNALTRNKISSRDDDGKNKDTASRSRSPRRSASPFRTRAVSPFRKKKNKKKQIKMKEKIDTLNANREPKVLFLPKSMQQVPILKESSFKINCKKESTSDKETYFDANETLGSKHKDSLHIEHPEPIKKLESSSRQSSNSEIDLLRSMSDLNLQNVNFPKKQIRFQRHYACKTVLTDHVIKGHLDELVNEIHIMRMLDHPYIIRLFEVYQVEHKIWLITELCTGGNLTTRKLSEPQVTVVLEQILQGVAYLHKRGVCHRDLKLENVLYEHSGTNSSIRLIDFGLSRTYDTDSLSKLTGAPYALSPEIVSESGPYTSKSDIWSLGVIVWVLIAGDYPFLKYPEEIKDEEKRNRLIRADYSFGITWKGRGISNSAKSFVKKCLQKNPDDRWTVNEALDFVQHTWIPSLQERWADMESECVSNKQLIAKEASILNKSVSSRRRSRKCATNTSWFNLDNIIRFSRYGLLKKTILITVAHSIDRRDSEAMKEIFLLEDTENSGTISFLEFKKAIQNLQNDDVDDEVINKAFAGMDHDKSGQIHFAEFVGALVESQGLLTMDHVSDAFDRIDTDGKGYISHSDLKVILGEDYKKSEVDQMIEEADFKMNGKIDYDELMKLMFEDSKHDTSKIGK